MRDALARGVKSLAKEAAQARGVQVRRRPRALLTEAATELLPTFDLLVPRVMRDRGEDLFVVQVGAFDGQTVDFLHVYATEHDWSGVLLEPNPRSFAKLEKAYAGAPGLRLRQAALSDREGEKPFYVLDEVEGMPETLHALASFDREMIVRHEWLWKGVSEHIVPITVQTTTYATELAGVERVDILQIDAEGFDGQAVRLFDFARWQPVLVNFEHRHLTDEDYEQTLTHLGRFGYQVAIGEMDTLAYLSAPQAAA